MSRLAVANLMKSQTPQGGSIIGVSSISALVGGELQWYVVIVASPFIESLILLDLLAITPLPRPGYYL